MVGGSLRFMVSAVCDLGRLNVVGPSEVLIGQQLGRSLDGLQVCSDRKLEIILLAVRGRIA